MPSTIAKAKKSARTRTRSLLWGLVFTGSTALALLYHILAWMGQGHTGIVAAGFNVVLFLGFASLWAMLSQAFAKRRPAPGRSFWSTTLAAGILIIVSQAVLLIARPPATVDPLLSLGFDLETGAPLVLATVFKAWLLGLLYGCFAVFLMLRLRDLVLVKRTRSSQRNWRLMVGSMVIASFSVFGLEAGEEINQIQVITIIIAVVFMVVCSFRLSWIVFLSFREKMGAIGLSLLLLFVISMGVGIMDDSQLARVTSPGLYTYVQSFSYPLSVFSSLASIFGILYCTTAVLSLLFHLPTTGEFEARAGERAAMQSLTSIVGQVLDTDRLHAAIAASPVEAGVAGCSWLAISDPASGSLSATVVSASGILKEEIAALIDLQAFFDDAVSTRRPLILDEAIGDRRVRSQTAGILSSMVIAPLIGRERVLGALFVGKDVVRGFERDEVDTVAILAAQASLAIENSNLFGEQVERERLSRELAIAREVQQRLLPQKVPTLPGLSVAASSVSAEEVGGDYYDFVELRDGRLGIIIADVSGKGTSAAFYMAEMQGIFQAVSRLVDSPADFLHHANVAISESLDRNVFVSVIYGVVDTRKQEFVLARAGHCPAAAVGMDGNARYLRSQGIGLGLDRGTLFRKTLTETTVKLQPGDVFVLYTDGVVESRSPDGEEYGYDRLLEVLAENRQEDASDIHAAMIADLNTYITETGEYGDDMTMMVLKWHGLHAGNSAPALDVARTIEQA
ncbi:MAG: sigma-B regulation protein RsbU (phosphoserine phosphatase) [Rhodothermales bacterium]|jgi:sigma-B regulation protein RsbU (phosphoserine phosphatase)